MKSLKPRSSFLLTAVLLTGGWTILNIGYYDTHWAEDNITVFFIKKEPTLQMKFENMFATDSDFDPVHELSDNDRQDLIDYCRYHLGYITRIENEADRDGCLKAYIDSFKKQDTATVH
jgi:hypothetical protein